MKVCVNLDLKLAAVCSVMCLEKWMQIDVVLLLPDPVKYGQHFWLQLLTMTRSGSFCHA